MSLVNPQLQVFSEPLEDLSVESMEFYPFAPDTENPGTTQTKYDITVKDLDSYINFSRSYLQINCKIVTSAGANIANENIALQNSGFSLIERATVLVDNQIVEECNHAPQVTTMKFLAESSDDYYRTNGSNMYFYKDTGLGTAVPADNVGFSTRKAFASASANMTLYLPMKHLFGYATNDKVTKGLRHTLSLTRASHANMIHQDANASAGSQVYISKMRLWVPIIRPSLRAVQNIESKLNQGFKQKLNWDAHNGYRSGTFSANLTEINWRIIKMAHSLIF